MQPTSPASTSALRPTPKQSLSSAAAEERPQTAFAQSFLDALETCIDASDDTSTLIRQSLPIFMQGSELDEYETHGQDVVWIASAVEQLCDVSGRNKDTKMADKVVAALGDDWSDDDKRQLRRWMREFYAKRSEIHGNTAERERWPYWAHALLGARCITCRSSSTCLQRRVATPLPTTIATMPRPCRIASPA